MPRLNIHAYAYICKFMISVCVCVLVPYERNSVVGWFRAWLMVVWYGTAAKLCPP